MKKLLLIGLIWAAFLQPMGCNADDADTHFAAHFGMSFAINALTYGIAKQAFHLEPWQAFIFSAGLTLMAGLTYKFMELQPDGSGSASIPRAMLRNAAGVAAFGLTTAIFNF